ncbi:hypothetical protein AB0G02_16645 [Actinosynnema sp. NPDC023658]|uniref:hypothetical protein n=1 Tax=Actinosynnema sp. NPDC023658 TaxID=3155465 RepID=UPI0033D4D46E
MLPVEGQPGTTVDTDYYAAWAPAEACPIDIGGGERTTMEADARRTAFRAATQSADATRIWQVAAYPDPGTAHQAYLQLFDAIDRCTTGPQSDRLPRDDINADEAFVKTFHRPAGRIGDRTATHRSFTVARVGTAVVAHELDEKEVPIRDPRAQDEPTAVAMGEFLRSLCDRHHRCRT